MGPEAEDPGFSFARSLRFVYHESETSTYVVYSRRKMYDLYYNMVLWQHFSPLSTVMRRLLTHIFNI